MVDIGIFLTICGECCNIVDVVWEQLYYIIANDPAPNSIQARKVISHFQKGAYHEKDIIDWLICADRC